MLVMALSLDSRLHEEEFSGACLQGYISTSYDTLVGLFGKPYKGDGHKVDARWGLTFRDGQIATIYNYKTGRNYLGKSGKPVEEINWWHVGGVSKDIMNLIKVILPGGLGYVHYSSTWARATIRHAAVNIRMLKANKEPKTKRLLRRMDG